MGGMFWVEIQDFRTKHPKVSDLCFLSKIHTHTHTPKTVERMKNNEKDKTPQGETAQEKNGKQHNNTQVVLCVSPPPPPTPFLQLLQLLRLLQLLHDYFYDYLLITLMITHDYSYDYLYDYSSYDYSYDYSY